MVTPARIAGFETATTAAISAFAIVFTTGCIETDPPGSTGLASCGQVRDHINHATSIAGFLDLINCYTIYSVDDFGQCTLSDIWQCIGALVHLGDVDMSTVDLDSRFESGTTSAIWIHLY